MKLTYHTHQEKELFIRFLDQEYKLNDGDMLQIADEIEMLQIYTKPAEKMNLFHVFIVLLKRLFLNIFNVLIMNDLGEWYAH